MDPRGNGGNDYYEKLYDKCWCKVELGNQMVAEGESRVEREFVYLFLKDRKNSSNMCC